MSSSPTSTMTSSIAMTNNDDDSVAPKKKVMKVTLLSGFLGAGKTTLLKRILRVNNERSEDKKLKIAVIVNDMGELNLDAEEIKNSRVVQEDAEMVEMHNGCICCTLRGDLLKTVKQLSEGNRYDYLVIESTGIGEPLPVAQTFAMDIEQMTGPNGTNNVENAKLTVAEDEKKSLFHYAILDTLVTVVDALNIYDVLSSIETLADKENASGMVGNTGTGDEAEYPGGEEARKEQKAAVVAASINMPRDRLKKELAKRKLETTGSKKVLADRLVEAFEEQLSAQLMAQVDDRSIAKLWLDQIEFANVIIVSKAAQFLQNGTQKQLKEIECMIRKINPKARVLIPTKDQYLDLDVSANLINTGLFDMEEASASIEWAQELVAEEHNPETLEYGISSTTFVANDMPFHPLRLKAALGGFSDWRLTLKGDNEGNRTFKGVVRTKGQIWLANCNAFPVYFQQAGKHVDMKPSEMPFYAERNIKDFSKDEKEVYGWMKEKGMLTERWGDRKSQLVFIGTNLDAENIQKRLTQALLTEEESIKVGGLEGWRTLEDPFYGGELTTMCDSFHAYVAKHGTHAGEGQ